MTSAHTPPSTSSAKLGARSADLLRCDRVSSALERGANATLSPASGAQIPRPGLFCTVRNANVHRTPMGVHEERASKRGLVDQPGLAQLLHQLRRGGSDPSTRAASSGHAGVRPPPCARPDAPLSSRAGGIQRETVNLHLRVQRELDELDGSGRAAAGSGVAERLRRRAALVAVILRDRRPAADTPKQAARPRAVPDANGEAT